MTKSYSRDIQVLTKMLLNIDKARNVVSQFQVDFNASSSRVLYKNPYAFDLCAFYMAQLGEKVKLLTDSTRNDLSSVVDLGVLKYFRNLIDHDYEAVNKILLQGYIQVLVSDSFRNAVISRLNYCKCNKK